MSYDQKKGQESNWEFDSQPHILERRGQMRSDWGMLYIVGDIYVRAIRYCPHILKNDLI
jgi:hypothetical protein